MIIKIIAAIIMLLGLSSAFSLPAQAGSCKPTVTTRCEVIVDQDYQGGGHDPDVVPIKACLDSRMFESIQLDDGRSGWEVGFYYGNGEPEVVMTVQNSQCWTHSKQGTIQHGVPGAMVIAYIDCDYYRGWVAGRIGPHGGDVRLQKFDLPRQHDPLN